MTKEEFIGRAADAILRHEAEKGAAIGGTRAQKLCPVWTSEIAETALEAVGAWELLESLRPIVTADGGGSFRNLTGMNAQLALLAIAKAEGR